MKTLLALILSVIFLPAIAQQKYQNGFVQAEHTKYEASISKQRYSSMLTLNNAANQLTDAKMVSTRDNYVDRDFIGIKVDRKAIERIFKQEIDPQTWATLAKDAHNFVAVFFKFSTAGKIIELSFITNVIGPIEPETFEKIETRLKSEITATYLKDPVPKWGVPAYTTFNFIEDGYRVVFYSIKEN